MNNLTIEQIYKKLQKLEFSSNQGTITFKMFNNSFLINDKSIIGYVIQNWFEEWMLENEINYSKNNNTQEPPDFFINDNKELLEIKAFDYDASANFDIANFESYCSMLEHDITKLKSFYLIFAYTLNDGYLTIKNIWLKHIWEITCQSEKYALKTQVKRGIIYNIRPASWYKTKTKYNVFSSKEDFIKAVYDTMKKYKKTKKYADVWYQKIETELKTL